MLKRLANDTRGQPIGIARFFLSLAVGAIVCFAILTPVAMPLLDNSMAATDHAQTNQATMWFQEIINFTPVIFLFLASFGLVVYALFQRAQV